MNNCVKISEEFNNYIQGLQYEKDSRRELLIFMLNNNLNSQSKFDKIHNEYLEFFMEYELAKRILEEIYLIPKFKTMSHWSLDFQTKEVTVLV